MTTSISDACIWSIFDLPNKILSDIILNLNARERAAFANASKRFYPLVFRDKYILRNLDFSEEGRLTSLSDIDQYFRSKSISRHVRKVNLTNVTCVSSYHMLSNVLGRGINLVDINIQRIDLSIRAMFAVLGLFPQLKRLAIDWPQTSDIDLDLCESALRKPFGRLRYLSVRMCWTQYSPEFIVSLQLCKKLEELRITQVCVPLDNYDRIWFMEEKRLENLKLVEYCGRGSIEVMSSMLSMLPDLEKWTNFVIALDSPFNGFYFEKDVEVCEEFARLEFIKSPLSDRLLRQVIMQTCEYGELDFCCLREEDKLSCLMKIEEMKMLLKNPRYKLRYLRIAHSIESYCSAHLLGSIFPTLTELVLSNIIKAKKWSSLFPHPKKRLRRIGEPHSKDLWNKNKSSSFKMLAKNTPHLRHLTIVADETLRDDEEWDLEGLRLITGWKSLRSLCLKHIPIMNGEFLIEIGKECVHLEKLELFNLGPQFFCVYDNELRQMLSHCKNLRDVKIIQSSLPEISRLLLSLDNNLELRKVLLRSHAQNDTTKPLVSAIEHLLKKCPKLTTLFCTVDWLAKVDMAQLTLALRRFRVELNRSTLQFQVVDDDDAEDVVLEDYSPPSFPWNLDRFDCLHYRL